MALGEFKERGVIMDIAIRFKIIGEGGNSEYGHLIRDISSSEEDVERVVTFFEKSLRAALSCPEGRSDLVDRSQGTESSDGDKDESVQGADEILLTRLHAGPMCKCPTCNGKGRV